VTRISPSWLLLCLLAAATAHAQHIGIAGRYGIGLLEWERTTPSWSAWCGCSETGSAFAQQALFTATLLYGDAPSPLAAAARVGVGTGVSRFISNPYSSTRPDLPASTQLEYRESNATVSLRLGVDGLYRTGSTGLLVFGPWLEYLVDAKVTRTERIVSPNGASFPGAGAERALDGATTAPPSMRWGMAAGFSLSLEVGEGVRVMPQLVLEGDVDALRASRPGALVLAAGTAVLFDLRELARPPIAASDAPPDDRAIAAVPPPAATTATVDIYAIDGAARAPSARLRRELVHRRLVAQLSRYVAIDSSDAGALRTGVPAHARFTLDSLAGLEPDALGEHALDIVGLRMRANAASRLRLIGPRADAERVREYLAGAWAIDRERIAVVRGSGRVVRLSSSTRSLLAPVALEWLDERFVMPPIGIDPRIDAPHGVRASRLRIVRAGRELAIADAGHSSTIDAIAIDLADAIVADSAAPIVAELDVVDSSGTSVRATDALPLSLPAPSADAPDRSMTTLVFDEGGASDDASLAVMLDELRRAVRSGAHARLRFAPATAAPIASQAARTSSRAELDATRAAVRAVLEASGVDVDDDVATGDASGALVVEITVGS
jgi:hypothetical protein